MELKPGYKKTEIGEIPEDWELLALREVIKSYELGGNYPNAITPSLFPLMKMGNVSRGNFDLTKIEFISSGIPQEAHRLKRGDVILNTRNTLDLVGKIAIWRDEIPLAYFNSNLMRLHFDPTVISSNEYANLTLNSEGTLSRLRAMATGTTSVAAIYTRDLLGLPIIVPPLPEQKAIAEALSDVDALISALSRLIAKKRHLRQGAMQRLLTGETRLPGFQGQWEYLHARDIGVFRGGGGFPLVAQGETSGQYPFFKVSDMNNEGNETFMITANNYISESTRKRLGITAFPAGSIVFAKVGAAVFLERKKILRQASCIDNNMAAFVLDERRVDVGYIHYLLLTKKLGSLVATTALPALNAKQLGDILLAVPPLPEQRAIVGVLSDIDGEITALQDRLDKTRALKQAMMQALLTGRVRLPVQRDAAEQDKEAAYA